MSNTVPDPVRLPSSHESSSGGDSCPTEVPRRLLTLGTLVKYAFGDRAAIVTLAEHPGALWIGFLFVISAGFAREYDGEDLWHEPWHLLLPLGASLVTSLVLFVLINRLGQTWGAGLNPFKSRYLVFLSLYWLTAPLAWLYAIPFELFMSEGDAARSNLWMLALVAFWRVLLITRACSVLYNIPYIACFFPVMLFADSLALGIVSQIDIQIFVVMGGVRLNESESALAEAMMLVTAFGGLSWWIWLIGSLFVFGQSEPNAKWVVQSNVQRLRWPRTVGQRDAASASLSNQFEAQIAPSVWRLVALSLGIWILILPWTQPAQQRRHAVEAAFKAGRYREGLTLMSAHPQTAFPPFWNPPPRTSSRFIKFEIVDIVAALNEQDAEWVRKIFFEKLDAALSSRFGAEVLVQHAGGTRVILLLEQSLEGLAILDQQPWVISRLLDQRERFSSEERICLEAAWMRQRTPLPQVPAREWTAEDRQFWESFLQTMESHSDKQVVHRAFNRQLEPILNTPQHMPADILERVRQLLDNLE